MSGVELFWLSLRPLLTEFPNYTIADIKVITCEPDLHEATKCQSVISFFHVILLSAARNPLLNVEIRQMMADVCKEQPTTHKKTKTKKQESQKVHFHFKLEEDVFMNKVKF